MSKKRRVLWEALDITRAKWWYFALYIVLAVILIVAVTWLWTLTDFDSRMAKSITRLVAGVVPVVVFPLLRRRSVRGASESLGVVTIPEDVFPDTYSALHDMMLASGRSGIQLQLFTSSALNALLRTDTGATRVAVSTAFACLPIDEQRAAFAMLLARARVPIDSLLVGGSRNGMPIAPDGSVIDRERLLKEPSLRTRVAVGFAEVASAADREALLVLKDPAPMLTLLARLAMADRVLPGVEVPAVHACLAWPFGEDDPKTARLAPADRLRFAEAVGSLGPGAGDPESVRLHRLKQVVPVAETAVKPPAPLADTPRRSSPVAADARRAVAAARAEDLRAKARGPRVATPCPKCGASNAPMNRSCIACSAPIPEPHA